MSVNRRANESQYEPLLRSSGRRKVFHWQGWMGLKAGLYSSNTIKQRGGVRWICKAQQGREAGGSLEEFLMSLFLVG
jgi:hypothetical protein